MPPELPTSETSLLHAVLESALDCIICMDVQGRVQEFNPAAERTFGYSRSEVIGRELAELIVPPEYREAGAPPGDRLPRSDDATARFTRTTSGSCVLPSVRPLPSGAHGATGRYPAPAQPARRWQQDRVHPLQVDAE